MVTEKHNIASRFIIKTSSKGESGGNIVFTGIGAQMAQQSLVLPAHLTGLYPNGSYQTFLQMNFDLVLDQMLFILPEDRMATLMTSRLYTLCAGMSNSLKSNIVMTQDQSNNQQEQLNSI